MCHEKSISVYKTCQIFDILELHTEKFKTQILWILWVFC